MAIACIHRQHLIFHKSIKYDDYPDQGSIIGDQAEEHVVNELKFENTISRNPSGQALTLDLPAC